MQLLRSKGMRDGDGRRIIQRLWKIVVEIVSKGMK